MTPIRLFIVLAVAAFVAGCGVKGPPELAGDKADFYPRTYPPGAVTPDVQPPSIYVERYRER